MNPQQLQQLVHELMQIVNIYRTQHYRKWTISPLEACKCDLCLRADKTLSAERYAEKETVNG